MDFLAEMEQVCSTFIIMSVFFSKSVLLRSRLIQMNLSNVLLG